MKEITKQELNELLEIYTNIKIKQEIVKLPNFYVMGFEFEKNKGNAFSQISIFKHKITGIEFNRERIIEVLETEINTEIFINVFKAIIETLQELEIDILLDEEKVK